MKLPQIAVMMIRMTTKYNPATLEELKTLVSDPDVNLGRLIPIRLPPWKNCSVIPYAVFLPESKPGILRM